MSIFDIFSSKSAPAPQAAPTAAQAAPTQQATGAEGTTGTDTTSAPAETPDFKDLWKPAEGETQSFNPADMFNSFDPAKIQEATSKMNFTQGVTQEHLAAIAEGGEGAMKAFAEALNATGRQAFSNSLMASAELTKQALVKADGHLDKRFTSLMSKQSLSSNLTSKNPELNSPEVAPITQAIVGQLAQKYPDATPAKLQEMAESYLMHVSGKLAGPKTVESKSDETGINWDEWAQTPTR